MTSRFAVLLGMLVSLAAAASAQTPPPAETTPGPPPQLSTLPSANLPVKAADPVPAYWKTRAEKSDYRLTSDYEETMRFCSLLEARSRWIKIVKFGTSGQGRDLDMLVVSKDRAFTPELARASGKPILLIQNGIHSGEIEGKDACLELLRDMVVLNKHADLLDSMIVLVVPIFSVDAHERHSHYNRINQNGPELMGWRFTPIGLNLNRDYLKVETPEMRALISNVYATWWPHLLVDNHTTDGADYRFELGYQYNAGPGVSPALSRWLRDAVTGRVAPRTGQLGHLIAPYFEFAKDGDPLAGLSSNDYPPRFSTGYTPLQCRPSILVETHMLKPYATRVRATYDFLVALMEEMAARPRALTGAVAAAENETIARGRAADPAKREVVLSTRLGDPADSLQFKGWVTNWEKSDVTGDRVPRYTSEPWDVTVPYRHQMVAALTVRAPVGYFVPREWTDAIDRLDIHHVAYRRLAAAWRDTVEMQRIVEWKTAPRASEGHRGTTVTRVDLVRQARDFAPGDVWVPLDQRSAAVAVHLFEAQAPDGLTFWNVFDTVLEPKEYGEEYVVEPLARQMLKENPTLAKEFQARLAADTSFANSPGARVDFFYRRTPWADPEQNLLPVARVMRRPPESVLAKP